MDIGAKGCNELLFKTQEFLLGSLKGVVSITTGTTSYNHNAVCFTCCMQVKCRMDLFSFNTDEENVTQIELVIDSNVFDATDCYIEEVCERKAIKQLWSENHINNVSGSRDYLIVIGGFDPSIISNITDRENFTLSFDHAMYTGCKLFDVTYDMIKNKVSSAKICAKGKTVVYG